MSTTIAIMTAIGLAGPAGLNAYLALLIVGLAARFTGLITLEAPYDFLTNTWVLLLLGVLLGVEVFADKIPAVDSINDIIGTVVRPTAGGILALASTQGVGLDPVLMGALGVILAGGVHGLKATARPVVTATTGGLGNPLVSMIEDIAAAAGTILTLLAPVIGFIVVVVVLIIMITLAVQVRRRLRRLGSRRPPPSPTSPAG
jgi:hypothetical protein